MKKTIITLLAMAGVALGNQSITIGSYYTKNDVKYDAVTNFADKTQTEIKNIITDANWLAFDSSQSITLLTSSMLVSDQTITSGTSLTLSAFTFISRPDAKHVAQNSTVSITINGVTYTTGVASHNGFDDDDDYGLLTYSFATENLPTFKLGDELTFTINKDVTSSTDPYKLPMGAFKGLSGTTKVYGDWQGAFQLTAKTAPIPEPTTATLSLLALAGLAARRRRK